MRNEGEAVITVSVVGSRSDRHIWDAVRALSKDDLPPLTPAQREVAQSLHIPEEDYARSAEAGRRGADELVKKAERFARLLNERVQTRDRTIQIDRVTLDVWEQRFEVRFRANGALQTFAVAERLVDSLFEEGSREADEELSRVLDYALFVVERK